MTKRITKKAVFFSSIILMGLFGLVQSIFIDNTSKSKSNFKKEDIATFPNLIDTARADIPAVSTSDGDGDGDGSNGL